MHAAGFCHTVALCGTTLTEEHAVLLGRHTRHAVVMLDGDAAGRVNGVKSARLLVGKGFHVGQILLEPEQDPDSLLRRMTYENFTGYIKSETRFGRLEAYEKDLLRQIEQLLSDLKIALTITERNDLFARMITLHKRLAKVTQILGHSPVVRNNLIKS